jgi:NuA3 HAT complex component NTO1
MAANGGGALDTPKSKSARAYAKSYTLGAPLIPTIIVDRVMAYISKISVNKKLAFIHLACRYWSLKREARRGAPLLKRLYLEV